LIGLAIIQAFPGPNFNCTYIQFINDHAIIEQFAVAVYLGALTLAPTSTPSIVGAILGFLGIFAPGLILAIGFQAIWHALRSRPSVTALLRGVNAAAVGLVYTAVYRLWEIGYLTPGREDGMSLGAEPWWVVIAVVAYTSTAWFGVETWIGIVAGAALGLCWYGVVKPW
jgi:chromate transport protein ChrA